MLDASAGVELLLRTPIGNRLRTALPSGADEWVPESYFLEAPSVLRRLQLAGAIDASRADLALRRLLDSPAQRAQVKPLVSAAWAHRHNLTLADALYVVLARELHAPLVTTDRRMAHSPRLGIEVISPLGS